LENLISNLLAASKTPEHEVLNYRTDILGVQKSSELFFVKFNLYSISYEKFS